MPCQRRDEECIRLRAAVVPKRGVMLENEKNATYNENCQFDSHCNEKNADTSAYCALRMIAHAISKWSRQSVVPERNKPVEDNNREGDLSKQSAMLPNWLATAEPVKGIKIRAQVAKGI